MKLLRQIAERDRFWTDEFTEPALVIMTNREAAKQLVADDAKTGTTLHDPQLHDLTGLRQSSRLDGGQNAATASQTSKSKPYRSSP